MTLQHTYVRLSAPLSPRTPGEVESGRLYRSLQRPLQGEVAGGDPDTTQGWQGQVNDKAADATAKTVPACNAVVPERNPTAPEAMRSEMTPHPNRAHSDPHPAPTTFPHTAEADMNASSTTPLERETAIQTAGTRSVSQQRARGTAIITSAAKPPDTGTRRSMRPMITDEKMPPYSP